MEFEEMTHESGIPPLEPEIPMTAEAPKTSKFNVEDLKKQAGNLKEKVVKLATVRNLILVGVAVVVLIVAIFGIRYATNNYMTPVRNLEKLMNQSNVNMDKLVLKSFKSLGAENSKSLLKALSKSDGFQVWMELTEEGFEMERESSLDTYGENYKISYKLEDKSELKKSELRDYKKDLRSMCECAEDLVESTRNYDSYDWEDLADELELTKSQTKNLVAELKVLVEEVSHLDVTAGYELELVTTITGDELDEPEEGSETIWVLKVNGKWITSSDLIGPMILEAFLDDWF